MIIEFATRIDDVYLELDDEKRALSMFYKMNGMPFLANFEKGTVKILNNNEFEYRKSLARKE